jgi:hypothetical protein
MSEFENPRRTAPGYEPTVEDIHALTAAATPHFAGQLSIRVRRLIEGLPANSPVRAEGERALAVLHDISFGGETRGHAPAQGQPTLSSVSEQTTSDEQI